MATQPSLLDTTTPLPVGTTAEAAVPPERLLDFSMQPQKETEWCWAAVSTSVSLFYEQTSAWTQCTVVNSQLGQTTCCTQGSSTTCNVASYLTPALQLVGHLAHDFGRALSMAEIAVEIDAGRPVALCIDWTGGGGHFVVIDGYDETAGTVDIKDSLFGASTEPLSQFPASYQGGGTWSWTYLTR